jgi:parvulin-like peptidyl-prolyl isomerase
VTQSDTSPAVRGRKMKFVLGGLLAIALCGVVRYYWAPPPAHADSSTESEAVASAAPAGESEETARTDDRQSSEESPAKQGDSSASGKNAKEGIPAIVANVNTQRISRDELGRQCLRHYGKEALESMVNKRLIQIECRRQQVVVTRAEVDHEIERMAKQFRIPVEQWFKLIQKERNVTPEQYASTVIWPTIALRKIAGEQVAVSQKEIKREFETQFGEQIRARLIAVSSQQKAEALRAKAVANPKAFGDLAKEYSEDSNSASVKGIINPIRRHGSYEEIEDAIFNIRDGEITPVIKAGGQYVILKREGVIPAQQIDIEDQAPKIKEFLRDRKSRSVATKVFKALQDKAVEDKAIQIVWDNPAMRQRMPGVAAMVYDDAITIQELQNDCLARHGQEVLEGMISHKIVELECKKQGVTVSEREIDREIARAAADGLQAKKDGSPDVEGWLALIKKRGISIDVYRNDAVWTSVALKKLVGDKVNITDDDLQKAFEANYGERVRCKAIVLDDMRRAQQVFEMARKNNTPEHFGKLAGQYSIEAGSQSLEGDVPPIRHHGGQPSLEEEAFQLKPGELSGIIQVADKFVILRCVGRTKPVAVKFAEVRDEIYDKIREKKLQLTIQQRFESLQDAATVDNYLAGTTHSPAPDIAPTARLRKTRETPKQR